jgi:hypothetical protein
MVRAQLVSRWTFAGWRLPSADFHEVLQNYHSLAVNLVLSVGRTGTISLVATVGSPS